MRSLDFYENIVVFMIEALPDTIKYYKEEFSEINKTGFDLTYSLHTESGSKTPGLGRKINGTEE